MMTVANTTMSLYRSLTFLETTSLRFKNKKRSSKGFLDCGITLFEARNGMKTLLGKKDIYHIPTFTFFNDCN